MVPKENEYAQPVIESKSTLSLVKGDPETKSNGRKCKTGNV
jgi:hypothetical protein